MIKQMIDLARQEVKIAHQLPLNLAKVFIYSGIRNVHNLVGKEQKYCIPEHDQRYRHYILTLMEELGKYPPMMEEFYPDIMSGECFRVDLEILFKNRNKE